MNELELLGNEWLTQDVCITKPLRLSDPNGVRGHEMGSSSSTSSSTSSLQLEVSRLAGIG
jgi:hypothetical protein